MIYHIISYYSVACFVRNRWDQIEVAKSQRLNRRQMRKMTCTVETGLAQTSAKVLADLQERLAAKFKGEPLIILTHNGGLHATYTYVRLATGVNAYILYNLLLIITIPIYQYKNISLYLHICISMYRMFAFA